MKRRLSKKQTLQCKNIAQREIYNIRYIYFKKRNGLKSITSAFYLRKIEKEQQFKPKACRTKEIKIREEINEIENKKKHRKIKNPKSFFLKKKSIKLINSWTDYPRIKDKRHKLILQMKGGSLLFLRTLKQ